MDIENLVDIFSAEVIKNRPDLRDFSKGSVLYTLARGIALTVNEVYAELEILKQSSTFFSNELNEDLIKSINPTLIRQKGSVASGYVLANNLDNFRVNLPINTPLTDPITTNQYVTTQAVTVDNITETQIPVAAIDKGIEYNIPAGRRLVNVDYPRIIFTTGKYREIDNSIVGDIIGGSSDESIEDFQNRAYDRLFNVRITNKQLLVNYLLSKDLINNVSIETLRGGLIVVWITSSKIYTDNELQALNEEIKEYLPLGVISEIRQLSLVPISVRVQLFEESNLDLDRLIITLVKNYIDNLPINSTLTVSNIRNIIIDRTGIVPKILEPVNNITLTNSQKFQATSVEIINVP